jgi:hypothetical protein
MTRHECFAILPCAGFKSRRLKVDYIPAAYSQVHKLAAAAQQVGAPSRQAPTCRKGLTPYSRL